MLKNVYLLFSVFLTMLVVILLSACKDGDRQQVQSDVTAKNVAKSVSNWDDNLDFTNMTPEEIVQYAREHPKGFDLTQKKLLASEFNPIGPESDPYSELIPYDVEKEADYWVDLTVEERMLANGYELLDESGESFKPYPRFVNIPAAVHKAVLRFYVENGRNPVNSDELYIWQVGKIIEPQLEGKKRYDINGALSDYFTYLTSPVTGKLIEIDNPNFNRGNIYVTAMNDKPEMLAIRGDLEVSSNFAKRYPEVIEKREKYGGLKYSSYCRVFGETGVLFHSTMNSTGNAK